MFITSSLEEIMVMIFLPYYQNVLNININIYIYIYIYFMVLSVTLGFMLYSLR